MWIVWVSVGLVGLLFGGIATFVGVIKKVSDDELNRDNDL